MVASDQSDAPGIRHVLFDADGVIQSIPGGWYAAMEPYLGGRAQEFLHGTWKDEKPTLAGQGDYLPLLAARLIEYEVSVPVEEVYRAVWHRIEPSIESLELVRALRASGYGVHLGTNQERHRAAHMRTVLGYDALFDASCYSCDLGVMKPDPGFFAAAARRIGAEPSSILFIDDSAGNVEGARAAGLAAEQWDLEQRHEVLLALLADHGVVAGQSGRRNAVNAARPADDGAIEFLTAVPGQLDDLLSVLDDAAAWLQAGGVVQWPSRFEPSWVEGALRRGETWLVRVGETISATLTLDQADSAWDGLPGRALYVHRMAVRRQAAGLGGAILAWAEGVARERDCEALRLDCVASNARLRGYYEAAGFVHCGDATVAGAPGQRLDDGPVTVISRYELRLG